MSLMSDNFIKSLIISLFNTKLTTFLNMYANVINTKGVVANSGALK